MLTFLLVISFLLHGITAIVLIVISLRVSKTKELELKQEQVAREIEESFTAYLIEIKEENERLTNMLMESGKTVDVSHDSTDFFTKDKPTQEENAPLKTEIKKQPAAQKPSINNDELVNSTNHQYEPPSHTVQENETYEPSTQSKVYQLYDAGYTTEEIARQLDCGKTEIDLMLKFHPRKS